MSTSARTVIRTVVATLSVLVFIVVGIAWWYLA